MELSSSVSATWNLCTLGSIFGCLIILLIFNNNDQIANIWVSTTSSSTPSLDVEPNLATTSSSPPPRATVVNPLLGQVRIIGSPPQATVASPSLEVTTLSAPPKDSVASPSLEPSSLSEPPKPSLVISSEPPIAIEKENHTKEESNNNNNVSYSAPVPVTATITAAPTTTSTTITTNNHNNSNNNMSYIAPVRAAAPTIATINNNNYNNNSILIEPIKKKIEKKCNIYDGRWVYKPDSKPSYMAVQCPFMEEKMSCQRNKRPDMDFEKWSWQPNDCDIPLLNGSDLVEKWRNKRVIFVGDSLNRNMWESLSCILYSNIPNASTKAHIHFEGAHSRTFLKAKDEYNFTIEFFWTPYLVEHNKNHPSGKKVLVLDRLSPNNESWLGADIMIFNSGMHWIQLPPKKGWDLYEYNGQLINDMPLHIAYKRAMRTWAKWVKKNVDPNKTSLFFRSVSAEHLNKQIDQWCVGKTKPIMDESYVSSFPIKIIRSIEEVIKGMDKSQVNYMNVTKMSQYRIDAHPSIYRYNDWKIREQNDSTSLKKTADCGHWCLPGVPDTWNRMLYVSLYSDLSL